MPRHSETTQVHKGAYWSSSDPAEDPDNDPENLVSPGKMWVDLSIGPPYQLRVRSADDTTWEKIGARVDTTGGGGGGGGGGGTTVVTNEATLGQGATVTASSFNEAVPGSEQFPSYAIDENDITTWVTGADGGGNPNNGDPTGEWIEVDLGIDRAIDSYRVMQSANSGHQASSFKLQSSDDGGPTGTWVDRHLFGQPVDTGVVALDAPVTARYWRLLCTGDSLQHFWGLRTWALFSTTTTGGGGGGSFNPMSAAGQMIYGGAAIDVDHGLDVGVTATVPASAASHGPELILDDDDNTYWHEGVAAVVGSSVEIDLQAPRPISEVHLVQGQAGTEDNRADSYRIAYHDGTNWADVITAGPGKADLSWVGPELFDAVTAQRWKITPTVAGGAAGTDGWMIDTLRLWEHSPAGRELALDPTAIGDVMVLVDDGDGNPTPGWSSGGGGGGGAGYMAPLTAPSTSGWAWVHQNGAAFTNNAGTGNDALTIYRTGSAAGDGNSYRRTSVGPAAPYTLTALLVPTLPLVDGWGMGICLMETSTGPIEMILVEIASGAASLRVASASDGSDATLTDRSTPFDISLGPIWLRIEDNGATRVYSWSSDGRLFLEVYEGANTEGFTTADQAAVFLRGNATSSLGGAASLVSWVLA